MKASVLIVGPIGAGKTTLASQLATRGWHSVSASTVLKEIHGQAYGESLNRRQLQEAGLELLSKRGDYYFAKELAARAQDKPKVVIEGVRTPGIALSLCRLIPDLYIVYVNAPRSIRLQRVLSRDGIGEGEFNALEISPVEVQVPDIEQLADLKINNIGAMDRMFQELYCRLE